MYIYDVYNKHEWCDTFGIDYTTTNNYFMFGTTKNV
jgi:predicted site-specific integrase-resolvase